MSKRRRRSDASENEGDEYPSKRKRSETNWTVPTTLNLQTHLCGSLYDFLRRYKDSDNKCLSECLIRTPSRRSLPNYYDVVSQPIDLMKIQQKLKTDEYATVELFLDDVRLLFNNTKLFFDRGSDEYRSTVELERAFTEKLIDSGCSTDDKWSISPPSLTLKIPKSHLITTPVGKTRKSSFSSESSTTSRRSSLSQLLSASKSSQSSPKTGQTATKTGSTGKIPVRVKLTRSRAWVEEYANSDDPVKIFMSSVYDFHDASGMYVAEIFHELPSRQEYPEYYRVITEPLDLNMIRKNTEEGRYVNLKAIQDDMILLVKNAHHFNQPGSPVYRAASSLRKFIISRCAELERRFQTVKKTQVVESEDNEDTQKKVPKLKLQMTAEGKVKGQRSRHSSSSAFESQSDTSDEDELSSDGEESDKEGAGKLLLRIKKEKLSPSHQKRDPVAKVLKIKRPPVLKKKLMAIYRSLVMKTDNDGRFLCELFMKRPSASMYPQYYIVIKNPIDLKEILQKIRSEVYSNMEELVSDVELMVSNACTFNEEDSQVYKDAVVLKEIAKKAYQRLFQGWAESDTITPTTAQRGRPRKVSIGSSALGTTSSASVPMPNKKCPPDVTSLYHTIKAATSPLGQCLWLTFKQLPPPSSSDYFSSIKRPIDMQMVDNKYSQGSYTTPSQLMDDVALLCDNAYGYYPKESRQAKDAVLLLRAAITKYKDLCEVDKKTHTPPDVPKMVQKLLNEIVSRTLSAKSSNGQASADVLKHLVVTKEMRHDTDAAKDEEEGGGATLKRRFDLAKIRQWASDGRYTRLQQLQDDLLAVFKFGRTEYGSEVYRESFKLEKIYLRVRDEVCRDGALLWSQALDYTASELEAQMSSLAEAHYKSPSPPPSSSSSSSSSSPSSNASSVSSSPVVDEDDHPGANKQGQSPGKDVLIPGMEEREYVPHCQHDGVLYSSGDVVHLMKNSHGDDEVEGRERKHQVVRIESLWKDGSGNVWLDGCWYYHPEETFHLASRKFYEREVFKSDFHSVAQISRVAGKVCVLFIRDYLKFHPEGFTDDEVYVCESRYTHKTKSFKKIKSWGVQGSQLNLVPRDAPPPMERVPSVFAGSSQEGLSRSGEAVATPMEDEGEELMDIDELETSICDNLLNIQTSVGNPESKCTYFEQYCIDNDYFRLGDFVYLRSDQEQPFIARIDRMWTDTNGDPWIRGPWFVRPGEVAHSPMRMFYSQELFMSNIQDTNPMRSICGKCAVLHITDYIKKRPTEYAEQDVYLVESRYNEADKEIRRTKPLKHFDLSASSIVDEVYHFSEELQPFKVSSPRLYLKEVLPVEPHPHVPKKPPPPPPPQLSEATSAKLATPTNTTATPSTKDKQPPSSTASTGTVLNIPPQLLQKLLASASQISTTRPVVIPLQQPTLTALASTATTPTTTVTPRASPAVAPAHAGGSGTVSTTPTSSLRATTSVTPSQTKSVAAPTVGQRSVGGSNPPMYTCGWDGCGKVFTNVSEFGSHLLSNVSGSGHISKDAEGNSYCCWTGCPRNPSNDGKPFDTTAKLMRHLREVHLMKISNSVLGISSSRGGSSSHSSSSATQPAAAATTQPSQTPPTTQPSSSSSIPTTTSSSQPAGPTLGAALEKPKQAVETAAIMHPPSVNRRQAVHSDIYKRYIKGIESDSQYMSNLMSSRQIRRTHQLAPTSVRPTDWIDSKVLSDKKDSASLLDALWALRDQVLQDI